MEGVCVPQFECVFSTFFFVRFIMVEECPQLIMDRTNQQFFHTFSSAFSSMNVVLLAGFRRFSVVLAAPWVDEKQGDEFYVM